MEDSRLRKCPICGKEFMVTPEWALTDYNGNPVCSCSCNKIAYENKYSKKKLRGEGTYENMISRNRRSYEKKRAKEKGEKYVRKPRRTKPVDIIKKSDGSVMAHHPSVRSAAEATGFSNATVSRVCMGEAQTCGDYTFVYAPRQQDTGGNAIWDRPTVKAVLQFDQWGNLIARHDSQKSAALASKCSQASVSLCCRHKQHTAGGFVFMFEKEYNEQQKGN